MDVFERVREAARRHGVDPELAVRLARQESGGNVRAISRKGAIGPMQLMPGTARDLGVDPNDPEQNIDGGVRYLKQQLDSFGDPKLALAAYNAGPGAVRKYGGVPPYAETRDYVQKISGGQDMRGPQEFDGADIFGMGAPTGAAPQQQRGGDGFDGSDIFAPPTRAASAPPPAQQPAPVTAQAPPPQQLRPDDKLGFLKGAFAPIDHGANWLESAVRGNPQVAGPMAAAGAGLRKMLPEGVTSFIDNPQGFYDAQAAKGVRPGKLGEFAGNVAGLGPLGALRGVALPGAIGGALLSEKKDAGGVLGDAALGAVAGKVADKALKGAGSIASNLLGKAPKVMGMPELEAAKKAAYAKVDAAGFRFPKADAQAMASNVEAFLTQKGGKALYPEASQWVARLKTLANQKGGLPLSQLDDLRGDIYTALVKPGGKDSVVGSKMRQEIDGLIAGAAKENALLREARDLNTRFAKGAAVTKRLESADLARGRAYTGKNTDNTIRQKLSPLIDPMSPQRLRNATPDEAAALKTAVTGSKAQNAVRTMGTMLDPRGIIGMGVQATGAAKSGGLTLPSALLGMGSTAVSGRMSQKNVEELLRLIAAGGSKQALKKQATPASRATQAALKKVPAGLFGAGLAARANDPYR